MIVIFFVQIDAWRTKFVCFHKFMGEIQDLQVVDRWITVNAIFLATSRNFRENIMEISKLLTKLSRLFE